LLKIKRDADVMPFAGQTSIAKKEYRELTGISFFSDLLLPISKKEKFETVGHILVISSSWHFGCRQVV